MEHTEGKRRGWQFYALMLCLLVFCGSSFLLVRDLLTAARERDANQILARQVLEAKQRAERSGAGASKEEAAPPPKYAPSGNLIQYDQLWQQNPDMAGWLALEGAEVDLPVMFTPSAPEYYLRRAFDGSYALSGSLFLAEGWSPESNHAIIYGHNMKNGDMFGKLDRYQSGEYARAHPTLRFDTLTEEREYTILAAFYSQVYPKHDLSAFHYYQYTDLSDPEVFQEYLQNVQAEALYDTGAAPQSGDRLLTLSTCSYHKTNGRFVVVAFQTAEEPLVP